MSALDDRPVVLDREKYPANDLLCDGLPRQAAGPRVRFAESNPAGAPGRTYAQSLFAELPYMVGVLVRADLHLTEAQAWTSSSSPGSRTTRSAAPNNSARLRSYAICMWAQPSCFWGLSRRRRRSCRLLAAEVPPREVAQPAGDAQVGRRERHEQPRVALGAWS